MRRASTRVLPDPAAAMTATSVDGVVTAARCSASRSPSSAEVVAAIEPTVRRGCHRRGRDVTGTVCAMPYPKKLLNDYEELAVDLHPHWLYFFEAVFALIA